MKEKKGIPVVINLASLVSYDGMTDDPMQVLTTGTLIPQGNASLLRYTESQEDEATGQVTMNRMGEFANTMLFMPNKRFETVLKTPFGELPMAVYSRDVRCDLGEDSGKVHLKYELSMQGAYASTNELHLEYWANTQ